MAAIQEAVRRLSIQATSSGIDETAQKLRGLATAHSDVAVAQVTNERTSLSLDSKFAQIERRYNQALRNQQDYAKLQNQVNMAVAQNPALQDRANAVLASAAERYGQLSGAQKAMAATSQTINLQVAALAGNLGITGQILSAFGPWGFAAAVGLGAVGSALSFVSDKSHELAAKAKEIKEFAEATGLTTTQFQALKSEAGRFGVDSETLAAGLSKFTTGFNDLRNGTGQLLTDVRRINPALAEEMQRATDTATAFTLFGKAVQSTDNIFQRNALLRAGLGKGATVYGAFFESAPDVAKLTAGFAEAGKGIDENLVKKLAQLQIDIDKTRAAASTIFASTFGTSTLEEERRWAETLLNLAVAFKSVMDSFNHPPEWFEKFLRIASTGSFNPQTQAQTMLRQGLGAGAESSSIAQNISDAVPRSRSYNQILADQFIGPIQQPRTPQADLADMEKRIALLGSAATATEKYNAAMLSLKISESSALLSEEQLARARESLRLDRDSQVLGARIGPLGGIKAAKSLVVRAPSAQAPPSLDAAANDNENGVCNVGHKRRLSATA